MQVSEEVRRLTGAIDRDLADSYTSLDVLIGRRNGTINALNTANFAQGGVLGIKVETPRYRG